MIDSQTFCRRFLPYQRRLFGLAVRMLKSSAEAEDIVQDVYTRLWEMQQEPPPAQGNDEALLMTMTRNLCIDHLRRRQAHPEGIYEMERLSLSETADTYVQHAGTTQFQPDAGEPLERREQLHQTLSLMGQLPPDQQHVLRLRAIDGLDFEQIEATTGLSAVNVRVLLSRARKRLRELATQQHIL